MPHTHQTLRTKIPDLRIPNKSKSHLAICFPLKRFDHFAPKMPIFRRRDDVTTWRRDQVTEILRIGRPRHGLETPLAPWGYPWHIFTFKTPRFPWQRFPAIVCCFAIFLGFAWQISPLFLRWSQWDMGMATGVVGTLKEPWNESFLLDLAAPQRGFHICVYIWTIPSWGTEFGNLPTWKHYKTLGLGCLAVVISLPSSQWQWLSFW